MTSFTFATTPKLIFAEGASQNIAEHSSILGDQILLITDPGLFKLGLHKEAVNSLEKAGKKVSVFSEVEADPSEAVVLASTKAATDIQATGIIGFGGGSSMDVAKLVALLALGEEKLEDIYGIEMIKGTRLPLIQVPTTAGTGSEVTPISIVTVGAETKKGVVSSKLLPDITILDAALTVGLPPAVTAATGVDAMVHAIEAYTSRGANNNPMSASLAKEALRLLGQNITTAVKDGSNLKARANMLLGACLAGQAFANSPVAAVHALAYPLGGIFHVPHGLSNALVLPEVMQFNAGACASEYAELAPIVFPDIDTSGGAQQTCQIFIERLAKLNKDLGLETTLREVGVKEDDLDRLADAAMEQTRLLVNNPKEVTREDAFNIYRKTL
ncbi:iron-containing alcohol dehydrogenase [Sneathiella sp. P13V-1]|uniref:iron-containing alcohol dehydrogenase n=1 Tax=Sneathiella sp. P13V-1 TaxID=2697366 RepID=UPI00187BBF0E|nr:iron-containing alcohol dehydrogenase [Sneathiella sp. P13V-1]MBE7638616.1 iron-containing alcohol dehydrogenase [Sneathiella sp. P13V-1]